MNSMSTAPLQTPLPSAGHAKLEKIETVALWHAVKWMEVVLREWQRDGFKDDQDQAQHEVQHQLLTTAKRALRKVNQLRKEQKTCKAVG